MGKKIPYKELEEKVRKLTNEIEELKLEREESKKNIVHFMQESDVIKNELKIAKELIAGLSSNNPNNIDLYLKLNSITIDNEKMNLLINLIESDQLNDIIHLTSENINLNEELYQLKEEYKATKDALKIEYERAEIIEKRWKESENNLEMAENLLKNKVVPENQIFLNNELCKLNLIKNNFNQCKFKLEQTENEMNQCKQEYSQLQQKYSELEGNFNRELNQIKSKESYLKIVNKSLREEIRKKNRVEKEIINVEYLRNVIIKFLERKNTRPQLIPILSTLLKCSNDEQLRLNNLIKRNRVI